MGGFTNLIPKVPDEELEREVWPIQNVCWFDCSATLDLPGGEHRVGFRVKPVDGLQFRTNIVFKVDGVETRRVEFETELDRNAGWQFVHAGLCDKKGFVNVSMTGEDALNEGLVSSKSGLLIDRAVALLQ